ncbi:hypothetical protein EDB83DRAFT_2517653 [Lactarius deliciosus]|nr:hypothetical protein EDB83DRAFT_2517653 [Lactarius deliciosus]
MHRPCISRITANPACATYAHPRLLTTNDKTSPVPSQTSYRPPPLYQRKSKVPAAASQQQLSHSRAGARAMASMDNSTTAISNPKRLNDDDNVDNGDDGGGASDNNAGDSDDTTDDGGNMTDDDGDTTGDDCDDTTDYAGDATMAGRGRINDDAAGLTAVLRLAVPTRQTLPAQPPNPPSTRVNPRQPLPLANGAYLWCLPLCFLVLLFSLFVAQGLLGIFFLLRQPVFLLSLRLVLLALFVPGVFLIVAFPGPSFSQTLSSLLLSEGILALVGINHGLS